MKLAATEFVTLDGVYQGPGAPDEDRRGGFDRGGWQAPFGDRETGEFITAAYERMDAMLLGRVTWDIWASYWPHHDGGPGLARDQRAAEVRAVDDAAESGVAEHPRHRRGCRGRRARPQGAAGTGPPPPGQREAPPVA